MSFGKVADCLFILSVVLAADGMPQSEEPAREESRETPPLLEFTNGGIRLNFAGYHAEAGLGGLLRGGGVGGGLHASAGTPWGAQAGAGLGGQVNGEGNLGGGLYARAGLGRGRPEAAAGLGGMLDGSGRSRPISGGMYAGATPGGGPGNGVYLGRGVAASEPFGVVEEFVGGGPPRAIGATSADAGGARVREVDREGASGNATTSDEKPNRGRTNIQIIPRTRNGERQREKQQKAVAALLDEGKPGRNETRNNEVRRAIQYVAVPPAAPVVKGVVASAVPVIVAVPPQPLIDTNVNVTAVAAGDNPVPVIPRPLYPRWYFRKRFWAAPRKVVYTAPVATDSQGAPSDTTGGLFVDAVADGNAVVAGKTYVSGSLFDDIFNIPISALAAVNQLLRNNVG